MRRPFETVRACCVYRLARDLNEHITAMDDTLHTMIDGLKVGQMIEVEVELDFLRRKIGDAVKAYEKEAFGGQ